MPIRINQTLKNKLQEIRNSGSAAFLPERIDKLLATEGTENYASLNYELFC